MVFLFLALLHQNSCYPNNKNIRTICPRLYERTFKGFVPKGNLTAGIFKEIEGVSNVKDCVVRCCRHEQCNVAFMTDDKCYQVTCTTDELCKPVLSPNSDSKEHVFMVLVKPTGEDSWQDVLSQDFSSEHLDRQVYNALNDNRRLQDIYKDLVMDESAYNYDIGCDVGADIGCAPNEVCMQNYPKSRAGTCTCKQGYIRNRSGDCILLDLKDVDLHPGNDMLTERILDLANKSAPVTRKHLMVTAENKEVKLPINEVTLIANVSPDDVNEDEKYQYEWTSLQQPDGSTAVKHQNGGQLELSKLVEGLYTFKVSVSNTFAYGETFVNVTVLPPSRTNKPPQVVIIPANQTIKLPNTAAVLDASTSTDDDGIVSWHWELQQGPLGYQPELKDTATLQLNDLKKPGNYTFKLTVTDTDKATSSGTANVTVLKFIDYPPDANAGEDKIIYLPHNNITLNGNLSTDDHAITTWEWTKSPDDAQKAVDMQDTRTPYLQLSNLEEGMYTFTLKVTDSAGQSSTAQVHVFVKPPTNKPPVAEAGPNITISLPQTWVVLDASNSSDDNKITAFKWEQVEGPSTVQFINNSLSKSNVTGLTKGSYIFKVSVTDDNNNVASDTVNVVVNQNVNQKPKADAGGNFEVELPINAVIVNGSKSKDDWAIVKWKWTRDDKSLAVGKVAEKSDESPILILTDVIAGKYIFNLTVFDEQGLSDTDTVTVVVKSDPKLLNLVEITIDVNSRHLTNAQYNTLTGKLALLVIDGSKLKVRDVKPEVGSGKAMITFYVETPDGIPYPANDIVQHLREKLRVDGGLLGFTVTKLQTTICQNNCSGHGVCVEQTRKCECEAFWMQDMFKVYLKSDEDSDCSWSILYVVLGVVCTILAFFGSMWALVYVCYTWCTKRWNGTKPTTYKLIEDLPPLVPRKGNLSDSDTDSDVVFESRSKNSRFGESRNGHKPSRNGFIKGGRRVKT
jgi:hypothetical protein